MIGRREFVLSAGALALTAAGPRPRRETAHFAAASLLAPIRALERRSGGRLGVAVLDTASGARFAWRADERFPMCSTFKFILAGAILARVDRGVETLGRRIAVPRAELLGNSPFTEARAGGDASIGELCGATVSLSDNAAANLLLRTMGEIEGFNAFARSLGDRVTHLDRWETALGESAPGDQRDTSSPAAMLADLNALALGNALRPASRALLGAWLAATSTGVGRFPAGFPDGWRLGHKTGTGLHGTANDIGIVSPPGRAPLLVAAYLTGSTLDDHGIDAIHAGVARAVAAAVSPAAGASARRRS